MTIFLKLILYTKQRKISKKKKKKKIKKKKKKKEFESIIPRESKN